MRDLMETHELAGRPAHGYVRCKDPVGLARGYPNLLLKESIEVRVIAAFADLPADTTGLTLC